MGNTIKFSAIFWRDRGGAAAAEYALLLAIIAAGLAVSVTVLGTSISTALNDAANCIDVGPNCA